MLFQEIPLQAAALRYGHMSTSEWVCRALPCYATGRKQGDMASLARS